MKNRFDVLLDAEIERLTRILNGNAIPFAIGNDRRSRTLRKELRDLFAAAAGRALLASGWVNYDVTVPRHRTPHSDPTGRLYSYYPTGHADDIRVGVMPLGGVLHEYPMNCARFDALCGAIQDILAAQEKGAEK